MKLHCHRTAEGRFDYARYREVQIAGTLKTLDRRWMHRGTVPFLSDWLRANVAPLDFGICHGEKRARMDGTAQPAGEEAPEAGDDDGDTPPA